MSLVLSVPYKAHYANNRMPNYLKIRDIFKKFTKLKHLY